MTTEYMDGDARYVARSSYMQQDDDPSVPTAEILNSYGASPRKASTITCIWQNSRVPPSGFIARS